MTTSKIILILLWLPVLALLPAFVFAGQQPENSVYISGESDSATMINVVVFPKYYLDENIDQVLYKAPVSNSRFSLTIPAYAKTFYINIIIETGDTKQLVLMHYRVESGDTLNITERNGKLAFSGPIRLMKT